MGILDVLGCIVSILVGLATLTEKVSAYIQRRKPETANISDSPPDFPALSCV